jgi:NAD+ kinase
MAYTIRDPIVNATFQCDAPRGFANQLQLRSRCFDAHLVIDGGMSFAFNTGTTAELEMHPQDALRTVVFR